MNNQNFYVLGIRFSALSLVALILLWFSRELGFLHFTYPEDLITPGFALAIFGLSLSYLKKEKNI